MATKKNQVLVPDHIYVPKHEIIPKQEAEQVLEKYNFSWIIYNANSTLSVVLMQRDDWKLIYADKVANIFVKDIPENQYLIEKYPDVELVVVDEDEDE